MADNREKLDGDKYANLVTAFAVILAVEYAEAAYDFWDVFIGLLSILLGRSFLDKAREHQDFFYSALTAGLISLGSLTILTYIYCTAIGPPEGCKACSDSNFELIRFILFMIIGIVVICVGIIEKSPKPNKSTSTNDKSIEPTTIDICPNESKPKISEQDRESFLRWQDYRISQLSFSINLFLSFSIASIAFIIQRDTNLNMSQSSLNSESLNALVWWFISAMFGVLATLSRLVDFRYTAKRIRDGRNRYYCLTKLAGHLTWIFFGCEVVAYCIGVWLFLYAII